MTSLLEEIVAVIAPHSCVECGEYNFVLCPACLHDLPQLQNSFCVLCQAPTADWRLCGKCQQGAQLEHVWPFAEYGGIVERTIKAFKFEHARAAARPLAECIDLALPYLPDDWVICPVPTASARIRQRGYDQALLLAKELAKKRKLTVKRVLYRTSDVRQVGATRQERQAHAKNLFKSKPVSGKILLVDDVCTTGATLLAAAKALKKAGATQIAAAVVAWQAPKR